MKNEFKYVTRITRSEIGDDGNVYIEGIASSTSIDSHESYFTESCLVGWKEDVQKGENIFIELNHDGMSDFTKRFGKVVDARVQPNPYKRGVMDFWIRAKLNPKSIHCQEAMRIMNNPSPEYGEPTVLGMSINGYVMDWDLEKVDGRMVEVYKSAKLKFIGIVEFPSNPDAINVSLARNFDKDEYELKVKRYKEQTVENEQKEEGQVNSEEMRKEEGQESVVESVESVSVEVEVENQDVQKSESGCDKCVALNCECVDENDVEEPSVHVEEVVEKVEEVVDVEKSEPVIISENFVVRSELDELKSLINELKDSIAISREIKEVKEENVKEVEVVEALRNLTEQVSSLNKQLDEIKVERDSLSKRLEEISNQPISTPVDQINVQQVHRNGYTKEELLYLAEQGILKGEALSALQKQILKRI